MKKFFFLALVFCAVSSTTLNAQNGGGQTPTLQQVKDRVKPQMIEKTGLTEAQVDKIIELNFEMREAMSGFRDLSEADRAKKVTELKTAKEKKFAEFLTAEQIKAVDDFYKNMPRNMPPKPAN
jgi:hypothetical protein